MFGPYAAYIIPAYLATAAVFAALAIRSVTEHRARRRELASLEEQGVRRRSQRSTEKPDD